MKHCIYCAKNWQRKTDCVSVKRSYSEYQGKQYQTNAKQEKVKLNGYCRKNCIAKLILAKEHVNYDLNFVVPVRLVSDKQNTQAPKHCQANDFNQEWKEYLVLCKESETSKRQQKIIAWIKYFVRSILLEQLA